MKLQYALFLGLTAFGASFALAATKTWQGAEGASWNVPGNWLEGEVPASGDDVKVGGSSVNDISGLSLNSLTIAGVGAKVSQTGGTLAATRLDLGAAGGAGALELRNAVFTGTVYFGENVMSGEPNAVTNVLTLGAGAEVRGCLCYHDSRQGVRIEFDGGKLVYQNNGDGVWRSLDMNYGTGDLALIGVNGNPIRFDANQTHTTFPSFSSSFSAGTFRMSSEAGLEILGLPTNKGQPLHFAPKTQYRDFSGLTGPITIAQGGFRIFEDNPFRTGVRFVLGDEAFVDLNTYALDVVSVSGGYLTNTHNDGAGMAVLNAFNSVEEIWDVRGDVSVVKAGAGRLVLKPAALVDEVVVHEGTLATSVPTDCEYAHYRFKIEQVRTNPEGAAGDVMQFSELKLFDGEADVTGLRSGFVGGTDGSMYYSGEGPEKVLDGNTATKWCDMSLMPENRAVHGERCWIQLDFAQPQRVTRYEWFTANDAKDRGDGQSWRDPVTWRFQGSDDGVVWCDLDVQTDYATTSDRQVSAGTFACTRPADAKTDFQDPVAVTVTSGATLETAPGRVVHLLTLLNRGDISWGTDADLTCGRETGTDVLDGVHFAGTGTLTKEGANTVLVRGDNAHSGETRVKAGTLRFAGDKAVAGKFFRFTVKQQAKLDDVVQLGELALYDADGNRVNLGLVNRGYGVAAADLQPGQTSALRGWNWNGQWLDYMFDDNLETEWGPCYRTSYDENLGRDAIKPRVDDPESWIVCYMRLKDDAAPVVSYNLATGLDSPGKREANVWTLDVSDDGVTWTEVDARFNVATPCAIKAWYAGYEVTTPPCETATAAAFGATSPVRIDAGATLEVVGAATPCGHLVVDWNSAGAYDGFLPAANGVLELLNYPAGGKAVPLTLPYPADDLSALATWSVVIDGRTSRKGVKFANGALELVPSGLSVILK